MTHPLASSAVAAAALGTGVSAEAKHALKQDKYGRTGKKYGRTYILAEVPARAALSPSPMKHTAGRALQRLRFSMSLLSSRPRPKQSPKKIFMENTMRDLSTTLCRGIARQVLASAPLRARLDGRPVLLGRPVPTDGLA